MRVLIVEDEPDLLAALAQSLREEGYAVDTAGDGRSGLSKANSSPYDAIVLDLMLPQLDGWEVCRRVRAESDVPIVMLTARSDDIDKIVGLELGADDYLTKPFNPRELVARIKAILRRADRRPPVNSASTITIDNLSIYPDKRLVTVENRQVALRMKEFDLLLTLAENRGMVFSREKLLNIVWGYDFAGETRTVDVHVAHLRHKLEGMRPTIETVWGVGYKLDR